MAASTRAHVNTSASANAQHPMPSAAWPRHDDMPSRRRRARRGEDDKEAAGRRDDDVAKRQRKGLVLAPVSRQDDVFAVTGPLRITEQREQWDYKSQLGDGATTVTHVQLELRKIANLTSLSADGTRVLVCSLHSSDFWLFDVASGRCVSTFTGHTKDGVNDVKWSADERRALSGGEDGALRVWDVASAQCITELSVRIEVRSVAWWFNDRYVVAGLGTGAIEVWDVERGQRVRELKGHTDAVYTLDVSADQKLLLSASGDNMARLWKLDTGECVRTLQGHTLCVYSAVFSRDGQRALSGSADSTVRLWDLATGHCVRVLEGHTDQVIAVSWHPSDLSVAVSGSSDTTVRVWNVDIGACLGVLDGHLGTVKRYLNWVLNGQGLISCDDFGTVISWDLSANYTAPTTAVPNDQVQYTNAKVLVVGDSGAGKTGLSMRLAHDSWQPTDSTVGAWSTRWPLGAASDATGGGEREIWLWDFGGQHDQRLVHQLFMDDTALAVLVFDGQRDGVLDALRQWDRDIARAARAGCRKLLVAGRVDAGAPRMRREDLLKFAMENGFAGYFETSAKTGLGCDELKAAIAREIDWDTIPWRSSPAIFKNLKNVLLTIKDAALAAPSHGMFQSLWQWFIPTPPQQFARHLQQVKVPGRVLVTMAELSRDIHTREPGIQFTDEQLKAVLSLLSGPGVVWELKFGGYYLLHPELVSSYAQGLLHQDRLQFGYAKESDVFAGVLPANVPRLDDETKDRLLLLELYHTFLERSLCFREVTKDNGAILMFPTRFVADPPAVMWQPPVVVSYTFGGYVDEAYATLVVRLHHTQPFRDAELFRDYANFMTLSGQVGVKIKRLADPVEFEVFCEPVVPDRTIIEFCAFVHEHLLQYGLEVRRLRHIACSNCRHVIADREVVMVKIQKYNDAVKAGINVAKPCMVCALCDSPVPIWDSLEEHYARGGFQDRVRELQEYSKAKLQRQAAERILIADIISLVLQAGHEVEELPVPELGASLKVTLRPEGASVLVVLRMAGPLRTSALLRSVEDDDVLQFAPVWAARCLRVVLVVRVDGAGLRWTPLSGAGIENLRAEFKGRRLDVDAVRGWKYLAAASVEENVRTLALTESARQRPSTVPLAVPWITRNQRYDVFLSFRGSEPLRAGGGASTDTIRAQLVTPLAADLRRTRSVYFDEKGLADQMAAAPGTAIIDILQGVMSTQGGGVAALLISRTYFEREWPTLELASCVELHTAHQVRLLLFLLGDGVTPEWVKGQRFVLEKCPTLSTVQMHTVPPGDADAMRAFIKARIEGAAGDEGIAGGSIEESFSALKIAISDRLTGNIGAQHKLAVALIGRPPRPNESLLYVFDGVSNLRSRNIAPLRDAITRFFDTDEYRDLCDLVDRYEFKWHFLATFSGVVADLGHVKARVDEWWRFNSRL